MDESKGSVDFGGYHVQMCLPLTPRYLLLFAEPGRVGCK